MVTVSGSDSDPGDGGGDDGDDGDGGSGEMPKTWPPLRLKSKWAIVKQW